MAGEILNVLNDTYLKQETVQSSELPADKLQLLPAGTTLVLQSYNESENGHLQVVLQEIEFKGLNTWFIFKDHVKLVNGDGAFCIPSIFLL